MSRIGRSPISVPPKVQVTWTDSNYVTVKGPKGELSYQVDPALTLKLEDGTLTVARPRRRCSLRAPSAVEEPSRDPRRTPGPHGRSPSVTHASAGPAPAQSRPPQ